MKWFVSVYSWYRRGKNFVRLCNEYNIVGSSPLIFDVFAKFRAVCEGWWSLYPGHCCLSVCLSVSQSVFYFSLCLPEWWINVCINLTFVDRRLQRDRDWSSIHTQVDQLTSTYSLIINWKQVNSTFDFRVILTRYIRRWNSFISARTASKCVCQARSGPTCTEELTALRRSHSERRIRDDTVVFWLGFT